MKIPKRGIQPELPAEQRELLEVELQLHQIAHLDL